MIDLHCHILPCVDDGAANTDETLELLQMEAEQGVEAVCFTPHLREGMFTTPDEKIREAFQRILRIADERGITPALYLSREYHYDSLFLRKLEEGTLLPMGARRVLLLEFSYTSDFDTLRNAAEQVMDRGYTPMFAHVERYRVIQREPGLAKALSRAGVIIQVNADSILGLDGWRIRRACNHLMDERAIHVVASDAHDPASRAVNLKKCGEYLIRRIGRANTRRILRDNPCEILANE